MLETTGFVELLSGRTLDVVAGFDAELVDVPLDTERVLSD